MATARTSLLRRKRSSNDDEDESRRKNPRRERTRNDPRRPQDPMRVSARMRSNRVHQLDIPTPVNTRQSLNDTQRSPVSVSIHVMPPTVDRLDALFELDTSGEDHDTYSTPNIGSSSNPIQLTTPSSTNRRSIPVVLDDLFVINSPDDDNDGDGGSGGRPPLSEDHSTVSTGADDEHEVIIVESDDENNEDVVVTHQTALNEDEMLARRLQARFNQESAINHMETFGSSVYSRAMLSSELNEPNEPNGRDLIRDNMEALATRIDNWTVADARRFLMVTFPPGWRGSQRTVERHLTRTNPMLLYAAIMGGSSTVPPGVSSMGSYEDLLELAEQLGPAQSTGFTKEAIKSIKKKKFKPGCSSSSEDSRESCVICMNDFEPTEFVKTLTPCKHDFHSKCIDPWLRTHKTCPICRAEVQIHKN